MRNPRDLGLTVVRSAARTHQASPGFVRLSQLRKLRECEQVAAVCYRVRSGGIEFLLVQTRGSGRWTFPKGSAEPGLTHAQAAALEAFEEAGVHGRIEEASFACYVRRKRGNAANRASDGKGVLVNAHLCEVSRLSSPQESKRNRTWFSVEDARQRLREGRKRNEGDDLARAVDRAVERIHELRLETGIVADRPLKDRLRETRPRADALQKDALRKVRFDFAEAYGPVEETSFLPYIRRQIVGMRQSRMPVVDAHPRESLQGEVLQFDPEREISRNPRWFSGGRKVKALGTGTSKG